MAVLTSYLALGCLSPDVGHHDNRITHLSPISSEKLFNNLQWKRYYSFHLLDKEAEVQEDYGVANVPKVTMLAPGRPSVPPTPSESRAGRSLGTADPVDVLAQGEQELLAMGRPHLDCLVVGGCHEGLAIAAEVDAPHCGRVGTKHR